MVGPAPGPPAAAIAAMATLTIPSRCGRWGGLCTQHRPSWTASLGLAPVAATSCPPATFLSTSWLPAGTWQLSARGSVDGLSTSPTSLETVPAVMAFVISAASATGSAILTHQTRSSLS